MSNYRTRSTHSGSSTYGLGSVQRKPPKIRPWISDALLESVILACTADRYGGTGRIHYDTFREIVPKPLRVKVARLLRLTDKPKLKVYERCALDPTELARMKQPPQ